MPMHKKRSYNVKIPIRVTHSPGLILIACKGQSYTLPFHVEPSSLELGPMLPKSPLPSECSFLLKNESDKSIEIYSLDFDDQYIKEEEILRNVSSYNEDGLLFLDPREAGQPFWKNFEMEVLESSKHIPAKDLIGFLAVQAETMQSTEAANGGSDKMLRNNSVTKNAQGSGGKIKESTASRRQSCKVTSRRQSCTDAGQRRASTEKCFLDTFEANTPFFIIHGPPLIGKTAQAKLLSAKYRLPILNLEELILKALEKQENPAWDGSQGVNDCKFATDIVALNNFEIDLSKLVAEKLRTSGFKSGAIFDGIYSVHVDSISLAKCILYSIGLQPLCSSIEECLNFSEDMTIWTGNPCVYVLSLRADRVSLSDYYLKVPEVYHARMIPSGIQSNQQGSINYPYVSRIPSDKELECFFSQEEKLYDLFGGNLSSEEPGSSDHRVKVFMFDGLQETNILSNRLIDTLPALQNQDKLPLSCVYQVVKKPVERSSNPCPHSNFRILTVNAGKTTERTSISKQSEVTRSKSKMGDQISEIASLLDDKVSISARSVATKQKQPRGSFRSQGSRSSLQISPLTASPAGTSNQARWVLQPYSSLSLVMQFWSSEVGNFQHNFVFEAVGIDGQVQIHCKGVCAMPEVTCTYKRVAIINSLRKLMGKGQRQLFITDGILDFGPLPAGRDPEGFPGVQDSEHSKRLGIENIGLFDLHVDFEVLQNNEDPSKQTGKQEKRTSRSAFLIHPTSMDLKIGESQDLRIYSYPAQLGILEGKLICKVTDNPAPTEYKLMCISDNPHVEVNNSNISFNRLLIGFEDTKTITIRNTSALPLEWRFTDLENIPKEFELSEIFGILDTTCSVVVKIKFKAITENVFQIKLALQIFNIGDSSKVAQDIPLSITAEAFKINVNTRYPSTPEEMPPYGGLNYGTVRVSENHLKTLILENKGKYEVAFKFHMKSSLAIESLTIDAQEGILDPMKEQKVV
eukprot:Gb_10292 [translate_table: standard]